MDELIKLVDFASKHPWIAATILVITVLGFLLKLLPEYWKIQRETKLSILRNDAEKARLEILKLRYEIEAIKKQHDIKPLPEEIVPPALQLPLSVDSPKIQLPATNEGASAKMALPLGWLRLLHRIHPFVPLTLTALMASVFAILAAFSLLVLVFIPFVPNPNPEPAINITVAVIYFLLACLWGACCFVMIQEFRRLRDFGRNEAANGPTNES